MEISRKCLCDLYDFCPRSLFSSLCNLYPTEILPRDLKSFLLENSVSVEDEELYLLVRQYSSGQNSRLTYEDFCQLVLPSTNETLSHLARSRYSSAAPNSRVTHYFISLVQAEIKMQGEVEAVKIGLFKDPQFSLWKAFQSLNTCGSGLITEEEVRGFLRKYGVYSGSDDIDALMRRVDLEDDMAISYNEFLEALIPLHVPSNGETRPKRVENAGAKENYEGKRLEKKDEEVEVEEEKDAEKEKEKEKEKKSVEGLENYDGDEAMESGELDMSPRFKGADDAEKDEEAFETPEKARGGKARSMPSKKSTELYHFLGELLVLELEYERKLEFYRQNLIIQDKFSVMQAFHMIDTENNSEIRLFDFEKFLGELGIETSREALWVIFQRYGEGQGLPLDFNSFLKIFACYDEEYSALLKMESNEEFDKDTFEKFKDLLEVLVKLQENIESYKENYTDLAEKHVKEMFEVIDSDGDGEISIEDLRQAMKKYGVVCGDTDLFSIIQMYSNNSADSFNISHFKEKLLKKQ